MSDAFIKNTLKDLEQDGLLRKMRTLTGAQNTRVCYDSEEYLNFCSNNYLGLTNDPRLCRAAINSIQHNGFGSGASRLVCGNWDDHTALEKDMAFFKGTESCLVFSTGYMANIGIISALCGRSDIVFSDRFNHASIIDGVLLSGAALKRYKHCDMEDLERLLQSYTNYHRKVIITDSVFSMDGDIAPLDKIVALAKKYQCLIMVDEAHGLGVVGKTGKGVVEHFNVGNDVDIQMGTFSKAVGSFGAYCCAKKEMIDYLVNTARSLIYTTGMPPSTAAASREGIKIIKECPEIRTKLWSNMQHLYAGLKEMGFDPGYHMTPIIPIIIGDADKTVEFSKHLFFEKILVSAIRPPTVPANTARLRVTVMATHQEKEIDCLLDAMKRIGRKLSIIDS